MYWKIIRVGDHIEIYQFFEDMLKNFDRDDLVKLWKLVKDRFNSTEPNDDKEKALWVELKSWRLYDSCGIHILLMDNGIAIHMMIEKKYPLNQEMLSRMLSKRLEVDHESTMAYELLRFIRSQFILVARSNALQLLERAYMVHCNPSRTSINTESKLGPDGVPVQDPTLYRSLTGGLQEPHFAVSAPLQRGLLQLIPSVANVVAEATWLRNLLHELHSPLSTTTLVYHDNVSAVYMSANPVQHQQTKHIKIDIHFVPVRMVKPLSGWSSPCTFRYNRMLDLHRKDFPSICFENVSPI
ncbi:ribonuclease H-like domain-containing protein [Tanacetum coccineum]